MKFRAGIIALVLARKTERWVKTAITCAYGKKLDLRGIARDLQIEVMPQGFLNAVLQ